MTLRYLLSMQRAARGSIPPGNALAWQPDDAAEELSAASDLALLVRVAREQPALPPPARAPELAAPPPTVAARACDLSTVCPSCGSQMQPEHAHYRCGGCGYRDSCCF